MSEEQAAADTPNAAESAQKEVDQKADEFFDSGEQVGDGKKPAEKPAEEDPDAKPEAEVKEDPEGDGESEKEAKGEDDGDKSDEKDSKEVPEKYEFEVDDDEPITDEHLDKIAQYAKEQGLSQEAAQKMVDMQSESLKAYDEAKTAEFEAAKENWFEEAKTDKEIGGDEFAKNAELAKRVVQKFGTEKFADDLNTLGFGNHPELLRIFTRIGRAMSEDTLVHGNKLPAKEMSTEEDLYGSNNINN